MEETGAKYQRASGAVSPSWKAKAGAIELAQAIGAGYAGAFLLASITKRHMAAQPREHGSRKTQPDGLQELGRGEVLRGGENPPRAQIGGVMVASDESAGGVAGNDGGRVNFAGMVAT